MNSYTKLLIAARRFLLATSLMTVVALGVYAQEWQEAHIINHSQSASWTEPAIYSTINVLLEPDPSLGTVDAVYSSGNVYVTFEPEHDAIGVAEFVIEHWGSSPFQMLITSKYRVYIDSTQVFAEDDYYAMNESAVDVELDVMSNDSLNGGDSLTITDIVITPSGAAEITVDGDKILYTPTPGITGMVHLTYVICDEYGVCDAADVNICVLPDSGLPTNDTIYLSTNNKSSVVAYMPTGGFQVESDPADGDLDSISVEAWKYTPDTDFSGTDSFVMASDTLTRVVVVSVHHRNSDNYYAIDDEYYTRVDSSISFDVRLNDYKAFPIHTYEHPAFGTLEMDSLGRFTYTPDTSYVGAVEFEYQIKPTSGVESARVVIYVSDMPPKNVEVYNLTTPMNTPLLINYEIPLGNYTLTNMSASPNHGEIVKKPGWNENIMVGCDSVSGWDLNIYTPDLNYIGQDTFKLQYCVTNADECTEVVIYVDIAEYEGLGECNCIDNCVWPGDVNADGIVNMDDLLRLGWHIGAKGESRNYPNNSAWLGQYSEDWKGTDRGSGMNLKYADSNGDGVLSEEDMSEIDQYFLQAHKLIPEITGLKADYEFGIIPPSGPLDSGDLAVFEIEIGSQSAPVVDMHGLRFTLNIPTELYAAGSVEIYQDNSSWLGHDAPNLALHKEPEHGRLDVGVTRANGTTVTGAGTILIMTFIVVDDIDGFYPPGVMIPFNISATNIGGLGGDGYIRDIPGAETQVFYRTPGTMEDAAPLTIDDKFYAFPNPASDLINVHINGNREIEEVELYDMTGALRNRVLLNSKNGQLDVSQMAPGAYVLRVKASDGVITRKVQIVR